MAVTARKDFFPAACAVVAPHAMRQAQSVRTIFDTAHRYDAGLAGYDGPTDPSEGGFRVVFDGRDSIPTVILNGCDGEVSVSGADAILQLAQALLDAAKMANRMAGA